MKDTHLDLQHIQDFVEQLHYLLKANAVAAWSVNSESGGQLVAASKADQKSAQFRQSLLATKIDDLPKKPTFFLASTSNLDELLTLKATTPHNCLAIPLRQNNRWLGFILAIDIPEDSRPNDRLINYLSNQAAQQWLLTQQQQSQQRQLEEMTDQGRQWQAIYMGVQESIVLLDTKGKILTINPATERITGRSAQDMIGRHVGELFPKIGPLGSGIDYPGIGGLQATLAQKRPSPLLEAVVETKDKRHIWVNYTYTPLWDIQGKMMGLVRVTSDVSTIKTVEQMKNDFVSIASHELRTPLGVILGYLSLFLEGQLGQISKDQETFLERVYHSAADMSALVEDLLNISRIEAGRLEVSIQSFNLDQLILEVINHLELRLQSKAITIQVKHAAKPVILQADRQKVEQALTNIIDNAIKYTFDQGSIAITIKPRDTMVEVAVKDTGVGISPEHIGHVFEKFYRESNPLSIKEGGSGLGLYISRKLIELHGGTISVTSTSGQGSIFTVKLPIRVQKHTA